MRRIGTLTGEAISNRFCDYLQTQSIEAKAESSDDASTNSETPHDIWIRHETDVDRAKNFLTSFQENPSNPEYDVADEAERIRQEKSEEIARKLKLQQKSKMKFRGAAASRGMGGLGGGGQSPSTIPVTIGFIAIATVIGFYTQFANWRFPPERESLTSEQRVFVTLAVFDRYTFQETLDAFCNIKQGEIWRLVSPALLHGSTWHLAFNMINLFILGSVVERLHGSWFLVALLLGCQLAATLTQVLLPDWLEPPNAIGASGAVFGVFGFIWIRPKVQSGYPIEIPPFNIKFMLGFLFLCMTPIISNIANGAHVGGLLAGMAIAATTPVK